MYFCKLSKSLHKLSKTASVSNLLLLFQSPNAHSYQPYHNHHSGPLQHCTTGWFVVWLTSTVISRAVVVKTKTQEILAFFSPFS